MNTPRSYRELMPLLEPFLRSYGKGVPEHLREDYEQDIRLGLLRARFMARLWSDPKKARTRFKGYLNSAVHNLTANWIRTYQRRFERDIATPVVEVSVCGDVQVLDKLVGKHVLTEVRTDQTGHRFTYADSFARSLGGAT